MNFILTLAYLFFIGSVSGWVLELFFRKWFSSSNPEHKWINPGFCTGPYLPIYGFGLCALYLLALLGRETGLDGSIQGRALLFLGMAVSMTLIEYIGGLLLLKGAKIRLWDYSNCRGNIQGLICPLFSFFWAQQLPRECSGTDLPAILLLLGTARRGILFSDPPAYSHRARLVLGEPGVFLRDRFFLRRISCGHGFECPLGCADKSLRR